MQPTSAVATTRTGIYEVLEPQCCLGDGIGELFVGDPPPKSLASYGCQWVHRCVSFSSIRTGSQLLPIGRPKSLPLSKADEEGSRWLCTPRVVDADTADRWSGRENVEWEDKESQWKGTHAG